MFLLNRSLQNNCELLKLLKGDNIADNEQDNDFSTQSQESGEDESINDEQNNTNS